MKHSFKIAFCGIMTALVLVCMFFSQVFPIAIYVCAVLSGLSIAITVEEVGLRDSVSVYTAASILALFFLPDKDIAISFITVFGAYPIYKKFLEQGKNEFLKKQAVRAVLKILFINVSCVAYFFVIVYLLGVPKESFAFGDVYLPGIFLFIGNIGCLMYDKAIDNFMLIYKYKLRKNIFRKW